MKFPPLKYPKRNKTFVGLKQKNKKKKCEEK
jgi:hypothetical protein